MATGDPNVNVRLVPKRIQSTALFLTFLFALSTLADVEAPPTRYSVYSSDKTVRVDSNPKAKTGKTEVFDLQQNQKKKVYSFDWFAFGLLVERTPSGIALIRPGPWPFGRFASLDMPALSFFLNDKFLKSYSTLEVAGSSNNVLRSVSHYRVTWGKPRIRKNELEHRTELLLETIDRRLLTFNVETGALLSRSEPFLELRKLDWFKENAVWVHAGPHPISGTEGNRKYEWTQPRISNQRAIVAGTVARILSTSDHWTINLKNPMLIEPPGVIGMEQFSIRVYCTNSTIYPNDKEVWSFSGDWEEETLMVRSGVRMSQYERSP